MTNIFVRIIGEFKDKEFKRAQKSTIGLSKQFDGLRRSARRAFVTVAGVAALKRSVQAFAAEDAAVQKLSKSLDNLGLRFDAIGVDDFLENLEKTTTIAKEELYPAFQQLANATLSVGKSQQILNSALDIAAGTGQDLSSVVRALSRAYNGNFTSLGKLQTAYSTAELQAMGFEQSLSLLSDQFSGQAAAAADTYEGKIRRLNIATGDAAENIGKGVVDALEALGGGNYDEGLELIAAAGEKIGDAFRFAASGVEYFRRFWKQGFFATKDQLSQFRLDMSTAFADDPAKQRTLLRERAKFLADERKQTEKIRKDREKAAKLLKEEAKNQKIIAEAQKTFDMERIQIEAALKGKINDVEEYRLKLQRAILNENVDNVIKYTGLLKEAESQAAELADLLARLPEMAQNPFTDWPTIIQRIQYLLKELDWQIPIDVLFAEKGLRLDQKNMTVTTLERMDVDANNVYITGNIMGTGTGVGGVGGSTRTTPWGSYDIKDPNASFAVATVALNEGLKLVDEATKAEEESKKALLEAESILAEFDLLMANLPKLPGNFGVGDVRMADNAINVQVNVGGSVIAENDLVQSIANSLYNIQSNGQVLLHKRTIL